MLYIKYLYAISIRLYVRQAVNSLSKWTLAIKLAVKSHIGEYKDFCRREHSHKEEQAWVDAAKKVKGEPMRDTMLRALSNPDLASFFAERRASYARAHSIQDAQYNHSISSKQG